MAITLFEKVRLCGTRMCVSHAQLDTRLPRFSACNLGKLEGAWGRGLTKYGFQELSVLKARSQLESTAD